MAKKQRCLADDGYWKRKPCNKECVYYDTCLYVHNKERAKEQRANLKETEDYYINTNRHDNGELQIMQSYSLERKIQLTCERIKAWYEWWDGQVYISFSGGKDSTVLLDLVRNVCGYDEVPAVFVDTGLEYPEIRNFVKEFDNVTWLKPKMNFKEVLKTYGYPVISKEVSNKVAGAKKYLENLKDTTRKEYAHFSYMADFLNIDKKPNNPQLLALKHGTLIKPNATYEELKEIANNSNISSEFNKKQWLFLLFSPFPISDECCHIMKKTPCRDYEDETNRKPFIGQLAEESKKRKDAWYKTGCNAFYSERPQSNPMAFWTNQDVLEYIQTRNIKICSLYGNIVEDLSGTDEVEGQMTFSECGYENDHFDAEKPPLKLTGCDRTGCMFCGYGCHLEKEGEGRFKRMKETHPKQYEYIMKPTTQGGMDYKDVIDWLNEKGDLHIEY